MQREFPLTLLRRVPGRQAGRAGAGEPGPRYPEGLKRRNANGGVLALFVVDTTGWVRPGSFQVHQATDTAFVSAVATSLEGATYVPAERDGREVPQLVRQPFGFCMMRGRTGIPDLLGRPLMCE